MTEISVAYDSAASQELTPNDVQLNAATPPTADQLEAHTIKLLVEQAKKGSKIATKFLRDNPPGVVQQADEPEAEAPSRFILHAADEALEPAEPIEWLVDGLIEAGGLYIFAGDAGSAKTFLLVDLAVAFANGERQWGDYWLSNPGPVLLVDEESGDKRIKRRLGYAQRAHGITGGLPLYYITQAATNIRADEDINAVRQAILQAGVKLILIDALMDIVPGADENSVKDMQPAMLALSRLAKQTNAAIILIHHTNKGGDYRGSSSIKGTVDGMFIVEKAADSPVIEVKTEKARDIKGARFTMIGHWETYPGTNELERVYFTAADNKEKPVHLSKPEQYALRYMGDNSDSYITAIEAHADVCTPASARRAVYTLTSKGLAKRTDEGGVGDKATYNLTDKGRELWAAL